MQIIDFEQKGNVVRYFVGDDDLKDYYGDDWDDYNYEDNAGPVYKQFVTGYFDVAYAFDDVVLQPYAVWNSRGWCKDDMRKRKVPCICILEAQFKEKNEWYTEFEDICHNKNAKKIYFGDKIAKEMFESYPHKYIEK